jgi:DNA-binding transcriptional regulator YiaG
MLPDRLQDLKNLGMGQKEFAALFSSARDYLRAWEKARRLSLSGPALP